MRLITEDDARDLVDLEDAIAVVEDGFAALARGDAVVFPPLVAHGSDPATRFGAKAGLDRRKKLPGLKLGSYWPGNPSRGLAAHASTTILLDDATGRPAAIVSAGHLNGLRTAAADAIAVKRLARSSAGVLALVGAGGQAWHELTAVSRVRDLRDVRVWSRDATKAEALAERARSEGLPARAEDLEAAVRGAEIVVTTTASRTPLVRYEWISPGAHVSAMGADGRGKQELDVALVAAASRFADLPAQSVEIGEFQHAARLGLIATPSIRALGELVAGDDPGRVDDDEITIFDSSGVAIQDIAIAALALARAEERGCGQVIDFS